MTKIKIKQLLDYIPIWILTIFAIYMVWVSVNEKILLTWRHWIGLLLLLVNYYLFRLNHQLGVLATGLTLVIGLLGITQYSPGVAISYVYWTPFDNRIPLFYGQIIFLLWLIIHIVISGRYYVGIATKKYWTDLFSMLKPSK
jgi:hypothetical protein